jgi:hypothetical protein
MSSCLTLIIIMSAMVIGFVILMHRSTETRTMDYESENTRLRRELYDQEQTIQKCYDKFAEKE